MRFFKTLLIITCVSIAFSCCFTKSEDISVTLQQGNNIGSDYYNIAGSGFYGAIRKKLFVGTITSSSTFTIESISGYMLVSMEGNYPNMDRLLSFGFDGSLGSRAFRKRLIADESGGSDLYIDLSEEFRKGLVIEEGTSSWNISLDKGGDIKPGTTVKGVSLFIDSISYKDENDDIITIDISTGISGSTIHFIEEDPISLNFLQNGNYMGNRIVNFDEGTGILDAISPSGKIEVPIFSNIIDIVDKNNGTDYLRIKSISGYTTIYIDDAPANRGINSLFYFRKKLGKCNDITNWGESKMTDENGHAELNIRLNYANCVVDQSNNIFEISVLAKNVYSGTKITTSGFFIEKIEYSKGDFWNGTIYLNKTIPGINLYFVKGGITSNNTGNNISDVGNTDEGVQGVEDEDDLFNDVYYSFNPNYSYEMNEAYQYAYKYGITTMNKIENADMNGGLTRIAMAKMLSNYALGVLKKDYDTYKYCVFNDVPWKLDAQYDNGVTWACKLGIMGVGINNFRPYDSVTRAEFATALSRLLYGTEDGIDNYYSTHISTLYNKGIISNTDPYLLEKRGYVMLMLMRSGK